MASTEPWLATRDHAITSSLRTAARILSRPRPPRRTWSSSTFRKKANGKPRAATCWRQGSGRSHRSIHTGTPTVAPLKIRMAIAPSCNGTSGEVPSPSKGELSIGAFSSLRQRGKRCRLVVLSFHSWTSADPVSFPTYEAQAHQLRLHLRARDRLLACRRARRLAVCLGDYRLRLFDDDPRRWHSGADGTVSEEHRVRVAAGGLQSEGRGPGDLRPA